MPDYQPANLADYLAGGGAVTDVGRRFSATLSSD
jgi:hypothetical protein